MDILKSKLAQRHGPLAKELKALWIEGRNLGATEGPQRLELICDQYDQLSPNLAYHWIDPGAFQREVEDAQTRKVEFWYIIRNCLSLAPLVLTWFALFTASTSYQQDLLMNSNDITQPFLKLWQDGFHNTTWLTFSVAAASDVTLLILYVLLIVFTYALDRHAHDISADFSLQLQDKAEKLIKAISVDSITHIADQSDIDKVADAVKRVVEKAVDASTKIAAAAEQSMKQVANASTQAIAVSNTHMDDIFKKQIEPMMSAFRTDMGAFQRELNNYQGRLNDLTQASKDLANASQTLTANATQYVAIGDDIKTQIASLNATQQKVLSQISSITGGITTAAGNMTTATTSMGTATKAVETVATHLNTGLQTTINTMTRNVDRATQSLGDVGNDLQVTSAYLQQAAKILASIQFRNTGGGGFGGVLGLLLNRRRYRNRVQKP